MTFIPDKDEVADSNSAGPIQSNPSFSTKKQAKAKQIPSEGDSPPHGTNGADPYLTRTDQGVVDGCGKTPVSAVCETCGREYTIQTRTQKRIGQRRLCRTCRGRVHAGERMAGFTTPESTKAERVRANGLINKRIKLGHVVRPKACQKCGKVGRVDAHHPDYAQQDLVAFVCRSCHVHCHRNAEFEKQVAAIARHASLNSSSSSPLSSPSTLAEEVFS